MANNSVYKVIFHNQGKLFEIYARHVNQGELFGFVEVEELLFGERTSLVVDPSEEKLKAEFAGVTKFQIPMHSVIRIDEVERQGTNKILSLTGDNVTPFPSPFFPPGGGDRK